MNNRLKIAKLIYKETWYDDVQNKKKDMNPENSLMDQRHLQQILEWRGAETYSVVLPTRTHTHTHTQVPPRISISSRPGFTLEIHGHHC